VVSTVTFRMLFVFVVLSHHRRRAIHFNVTSHPTAEWTVRQVAEAFPWDSAPRYLLHDRDCIYGAAFRQRVEGMGIRELTAPRSPSKPLCRALHRLVATGVPGPRHCVERSFAEAHY
jgi:putative transposase